MEVGSHLHIPARLMEEENSLYPLNRRLGERQTRHSCFGENMSVPLLGIRRRLLGIPV
jgi:hypothetical protein